MKAAGSRVRIANVTDLTRIVEIERAIGESPHWPAAEYAAIVNAEGEADRSIRRCLFVVEREDHLVGFAAGKVIGSGYERVAELESVAVDGVARRSGVGRALCKAIVEWCRDQGATELDLEVRATSAGAIALYSGLGFAIIGRRKDYYRQPTDDAVLMRLNLDSILSA